MTSSEVTRHMLETILIVFLVLKLTGLIDWSWWIVTAPLWVPLLVGIFVLIIYFGFMVIAFLIGKDKNKD